MEWEPVPEADDTLDDGDSASEMDLYCTMAKAETKAKVKMKSTTIRNTKYEGARYDSDSPS